MRGKNAVARTARPRLRMVVGASTPGAGGPVWTARSCDRSCGGRWEFWWVRGAAMVDDRDDGESKAAKKAGSPVIHASGGVGSGSWVWVVGSAGPFLEVALRVHALATDSPWNRCRGTRTSIKLSQKKGRTSARVDADTACKLKGRDPNRRCRRAVEEGMTDISAPTRWQQPRRPRQPWVTRGIAEEDRRTRSRSCSMSGFDAEATSRRRCPRARAVMIVTGLHLGLAANGQPGVEKRPDSFARDTDSTLLDLRTRAASDLEMAD